MRKHYTLLSLASIIGLAATAQPTITSTSNPVPGDMLLIHNGGELPAATTGANVTWNYSTATFTSPDSYSNFAAPGSGAPAGTTVVETGTVGVTVYYRTSASAFAMLGIDAGFGDYQCSDPQVQEPFPFTMGSSLNDPYSCSGQSSGYAFTRSGNTQFTGAGYGTLILPYGTITNVLMVNMHQTMTDDFVDDELVDFDYLTDLTLFLKPGVKAALLTLATTNNVTAGQVAEVSRMLDQGSVGIHEAMAQAIGVDLMPNPANGEVEVVYGVQAGARLSVDLVDVAGRVVLSSIHPVAASGMQREVLDISGLTPGVYTVRVTDQDGATGMKRLVKQ